LGRGPLEVGVALGIGVGGRCVALGVGCRRNLTGTCSRTSRAGLKPQHVIAARGEMHRVEARKPREKLLKWEGNDEITFSPAAVRRGCRFTVKLDAEQVSSFTTQQDHRKSVGGGKEKRAALQLRCTHFHLVLALVVGVSVTIRAWCRRWK